MDYVNLITWAAVGMEGAVHQSWTGLLSVVYAFLNQAATVIVVNE